MKRQNEREKTTDARHWYYLALVILAGWLISLLSPILTPFLAGALLAYLGDPLVDRLERLKIGRGLAVAMVFTAFLMLALAVALVILPRLEGQISLLFQQFPAYIGWLKTKTLPWLQQHLGLEGRLSDLSWFQDILAKHWQDAGGFVKGALISVSQSGASLLGMVANLLLIPVITFYLLRDWDDLVAAIHALLPRRYEPTIARLARESDAMLGAFMRGQLMVMLGLGLIYTIGLWLVGLDFALLIGMLAGMVSFVPYLGLILGLILAGIATVLQFQGSGPLPWVALVFITGQLIEGTILTPRFVGGNIGMHPVAVIFAVMAGGHLYGFLGILMALPVAAVAMVWVRHAVERYIGSRLYEN